MSSTKWSWRFGIHAVFFPCFVWRFCIHWDVSRSEYSAFGAQHTEAQKENIFIAFSGGFMNGTMSSGLTVRAMLTGIVLSFLLVMWFSYAGIMVQGADLTMHFAGSAAVF